MESARKRSWWGSVLGSAAMAVPAAGAGYVVFGQYRSMIRSSEPPARVAAEQAAGEQAPPAVTPDGVARARVLVAPTLADPEQLRQKQEQDALLRRRQEAVQRRVLALPPSVVQPGAAPMPDPAAPPATSATASAGPKFYTSGDDTAAPGARPEAKPSPRRR